MPATSPTELTSTRRGTIFPPTIRRTHIAPIQTPRSHLCRSRILEVRSRMRTGSLIWSSISLLRSREFSRRVTKGVSMANPYVGEIRMFAGNFAPVGWAFCQGQLMPISENDTLFNLIGTTYGGDGQETFALPDLQSRLPMHQGQGPGISQNYIIGEKAGVESVTLTTQQIPV